MLPTRRRLENDPDASFPARKVGATIPPILPDTLPKDPLNYNAAILAALESIRQLLHDEIGDTTVFTPAIFTLAAGARQTTRVDMDIDRWIVWTDLTASATDTWGFSLGADASPNGLVLRAGKLVKLPGTERLVTVCNCGPTNPIKFYVVAVSGGDFDVQTVY